MKGSGVPHPTRMLSGWDCRDLAYLIHNYGFAACKCQCLAPVKTHWLCRSCYALKRIHTPVCKPVSGLDQALTSLITLRKYRNPMSPNWLLHSYQRKSRNSSGSKAQSALHTSVRSRVCASGQTQNLPLLLHWAHKHLEGNGFFQFPEQCLHLWVCKVHHLPSRAASNMGLSCILTNIL